MHPALSVIFFTTASGAGYGLLIVMAVLAMFDLAPIDPFFGAMGLGFSFILVSDYQFSLFSNTYLGKTLYFLHFLSVFNKVSRNNIIFP